MIARNRNSVLRAHALLVGTRCPCQGWTPERVVRRRPDESEETGECGPWDSRMAGRPAGPGAQVYAVAGVVAVQARRAADAEAFTLCRARARPAAGGLGRSRGAAENVAGTLVREDHSPSWALPPKPPAYRSGHREGEGVLLCPCPRHYGDTEGGPGPRASPDGRTRIRLQSGLVTVDGARCTGRRPEKPGPYCPHPGVGTPRTERCRSHLRQWLCRMWRTFRLCRHRPGHPERIGHGRWVEVASHRPVEQQGF